MARQIMVVAKEVGHGAPFERYLKVFKSTQPLNAMY